MTQKQKLIGEWVDSSMILSLRYRDYRFKSDFLKIKICK